MLKNRIYRNKLQVFSVVVFSMIAFVLTNLPVLGAAMLAMRNLRTAWQSSSDAGIVARFNLAVADQRLSIVEVENFNEAGLPGSIRGSRQQCEAFLASNAPEQFRDFVQKQACGNNLSPAALADSSQSMVVTLAQSAADTSGLSIQFEVAQTPLDHTFLYLLTVYLMVIVIPVWGILWAIIASFTASHTKDVQVMVKVGVSAIRAAQELVKLDLLAQVVGMIIAGLVSAAMLPYLIDLTWEGAKFSNLDASVALLVMIVTSTVTLAGLYCAMLLKGKNLAEKTIF